GLAVLQAGVFATVQDQGRTGYRAFGVPPGGAFDRGAADLANALLGNRSAEAVVELTLVGGLYEARGSVGLALAGAPLTATVRSPDGREQTHEVPACFPIPDGGRLVLGGWRTPEILGSRSSEAPIRPGSVLPCLPGWTPVRHPDKIVNPFETVGDTPVRVIDGPDAGLLNGFTFDGSQLYRVDARSDRIGLRFEGPACDVVGEPGRLSTPVAPGAVQVAGGRPIVLGVACGTMGGYPHVAHVISADLDRLAQARPGDAVRFVRVTLAEARVLDRDRRQRRRSQVARVTAAAADRQGFCRVGGA
ncbi:MAG: allophanate hydrolase, partial [Planctomycetia bacterium]|nr:allophanate hydrolase [Planctomycetia bacterium]